MAEPRTATENGNLDAKTAERTTTRATEADRPSRRYRGGHDRERSLKSLREAQFPAAMRGYDRAAVDRYVTEANRVIAELEISSSPEAAVRHALDEVSEETRDLLQRAHQTAEEITARSRSKADDRLQQAEQEASELRAAAVREAEQTREAAQREATELREAAQREATELREAAQREAQQLRSTAQREADEARETARRDASELREAAELRAGELARSAEKIWRERRRLLEDMRGVADQLAAIGDAEAGRFARLEAEGIAETGEAAEGVAPV
jgi:DivIVA domain-containing protein